MDRLKGKVAIVTGGSSGIGNGIVELFVKEGATVCVFDIKGEGEDFCKVDVSDEQAVNNAVDAVYAKYKKIDVLVNNAGAMGAVSQTLKMDAKAWDRTFEVNVKGVMLCTKAVLPYMIEAGGGSVINMASIDGKQGAIDNITAYHATKGAVIALTKQDAVTYGRKNIRVNAILPGAILTPLFVSSGDQFPGGFAAVEDYMKKHTPLKKMGKPEDVAYGALYLASDESSFVTGSELCIDGGYTAW